MWRAHLDQPKPDLILDSSIWHLLSVRMSRSSPIFAQSVLARRVCSVLHDQNGPAYAQYPQPAMWESSGTSEIGPWYLVFSRRPSPLLAALSWFQRSQIDEARSAQVILNQIAVLTREINNLTWTALQKQNLTPEAEIEMRAARQALPKAVLAAHLQAYHTSTLEKVWPALDNYIMSARSAMDPDAKSGTLTRRSRSIFRRSAPSST